MKNVYILLYALFSPLSYSIEDTTIFNNVGSSSNDSSRVSTSKISSSDYITIYSNSTTPHNFKNNDDNIIASDKTTSINIDNTETSSSHGIVSSDDISDVEKIDSDTLVERGSPSLESDDFNTNTAILILFQQCEQHGFRHFLSISEDKCMLACTNSADLGYHPKKQSDYFNEWYRPNGVFVQNYTIISVKDGFKCIDNGSCFDGKCVGYSNNLVNGNQLETTSNNVLNSNDSPPFVDKVTPALNETTNSDDVKSSTDDNSTLLPILDDTTNTYNVLNSTDNNNITLPFSDDTTNSDSVTNSTDDNNTTLLSTDNATNSDSATNSTDNNNITLPFSDDTTNSDSVTNSTDDNNTTLLSTDNATNSDSATNSTDNNNIILPLSKDSTNTLSVTNATDDNNTSLLSSDNATNSDSITNSTVNNNVTSSLDTTTLRDSITNDDSSDNNTISNASDDFKESTTSESILDSNNVTTPQNRTISDAAKLVDQELQILNEQCELAKKGYFLMRLPNKCFIACTLDKYMVYLADKDNDTLYESIINNYIFSKLYEAVAVQDGFKCRNNSKCLNRHCIEYTTTDNDTSSTDYDDILEESTSPEGLENSSDFSSFSDSYESSTDVDDTIDESTSPEGLENSSDFSSFSDSNESSSDTTTPRDLITNHDSSDNNTISNDSDVFKESTIPESILDSNNVTTPQNRTISDAAKLVDQELQILNEQCERAQKGYFLMRLPNKCFIACTLDKYLVYLADKDNDTLYESIINNYIFSKLYEAVVVQDGFKCRNNSHCLGGQCVEYTTTDNNTSYTDYDDTIEESTSPEGLENSSDFSSFSDSNESSLDTTTPRDLITNDDSSDSNTIFNDIDNFIESTTPETSLNF
ncbi:dentin sialophosphoprotein-like [Leptopilina heterotoma]|uniref:dentin sialophosphoprotein-like n=1 Tax=Leptopilina heterotoma TaxID=63436 RepID=UPI001CA9EBAF|nr:dentin sialophosphoprotein-like [Leptopilina heterotoma]